MNQYLNKHPWVAVLFTLVIIIIIREISVLFASAINIPSMGNIIGMIFLFIALILWRKFQTLPSWLTVASNKILTESAFAYLPVSAGAGILLFQLGDEFMRIMIVMLLSTLIPLWGFAKLAEIWLQPNATNANKNNKES